MDVNNISKPSEFNSDITALIAAFEDFNMAMAIYDQDGHILFINNKAMAIYGIVDKEKFMEKKFLFQGNEHYKEYYDPRLSYPKDIKLKILYNCSRNHELYPDIFSREGHFLLSLHLHPVYEKDGLLKAIVAISEDLSAKKNNLKKFNYFKDIRPFMMTSEGISTWLYDFETETRILDSGSHLFPSLEKMDDFLNCVHPADAVVLKGIIGLIRYGNQMNGKTKIRFIDQNNTQEGDYIYLEISCTPYFENGKVVGIYFLTKDVTDRELYKQKFRANNFILSRKDQEVTSINTLLHTLINQMPCLFFAKDADDDYKYVMANDLFCAKMGKRKEEIIGHTDEEIVPDKNKVCEYRNNDINASLGKTPYKAREETTWGDKRRIWNTTKYCITTTDKHRLIIGISQDITILDNAYHETRKALEMAEKSEKLKTSFLANISHEIRTPLNSILGFSSLLVDAESAEEMEQYKQIIIKNGYILANVITDIVDLSEIEAGYIVPKKESFNLSHLIQNIPTRDDFMKKEGIDYQISAPQKICIINSDQEIIRKIINISIKNTHSYMNEGTITIGYECINDGVNVYVENTGIGLNKEEISNLFERFQKLNPFVEGIGLGLAICKLLAKTLDGSMSISSEPNVGTKIGVWIPSKVICPSDATTSQVQVREEL